MKNLKLAFAAIIIASFWSCGPSAEQIESKEKSKTDQMSASESQDEASTNSEKSKKAMPAPPPGSTGVTTKEENVPVSSSAAVVSKLDSTRKFVRTADLKFKTKNVIKSTYTIEDIVVKHNGFVTYTHLTSEVQNVYNTPISPDSTLETTVYNIVNNMTIRVPNTKLDTVLKDIAPLIDFLDYRTIWANDVTFQMLANTMMQKRTSRSEERLARTIDNKGRRLNETINAEEFLLRKQEMNDQAKLANMVLDNDIAYSTIQLNIYQRESYRRELIANYKNFDAYEPGFGNKLLQSLKTGCYVLEVIVLFFAKIWWLLLIGLAVFISVKVFHYKQKKEN